MDFSFTIMGESWLGRRQWGCGSGGRVTYLRKMLVHEEGGRYIDALTLDLVEDVMTGFQ